MVVNYQSCVRVPDVCATFQIVVQYWARGYQASSFFAGFLSYTEPPYNTSYMVLAYRSQSIAPKEGNGAALLYSQGTWHQLGRFTGKRT